MLPAGLPAPQVRAQDQAEKAHKGISGRANGDTAGAVVFIKSDNFQGPRAGYAFKAGPQGTGYYQDA